MWIAPTAHDVEVVQSLAWNVADPTGSQARIDEGLDVERVTRRFYVSNSSRTSAIPASRRFPNELALSQPRERLDSNLKNR